LDLGERNMKIRKFIFVVIAASLFLWIFPCGSLCSQKDFSYLLNKGVDVMAPDFALKDLNDKEVKLSDYRGKVVLLNFSTTWCPHCRTIIPYLKELKEQYKDKDFVILNIDIQESKERVRAFATRQKITYRVLLDRDAKIAMLYNIVGVPNLILVDREGFIVCRQCRSIDISLKTLFESPSQ
jgi:peroxiredoxin